KIIGDTPCQLEGQMKLVIGRRNRFFKFFRSPADEVKMCLQIPHPFRHGLVLIDLNLKWVLRLSCNRKAQQKCHSAHQPANASQSERQSSIESQFECLPKKCKRLYVSWNIETSSATGSSLIT